MSTPTWDRFSIEATIARPTRFLIGSTLLGSSIPLGSDVADLDIAGKAVEAITITYGVEPQRYAPKPFVGTCVIQLLNPLYALNIGMPVTVRLYDFPAIGEPLFTGKISEVSTSIDPLTGDRHTTVTIIDRVAELANTPRDGSVGMPLGVEFTQSRIARLLAGQRDTITSGPITTEQTYHIEDFGPPSSLFIRSNWAAGTNTPVIPSGGDTILFALLEEEEGIYQGLITGLIPGEWYGLSAHVDNDDPNKPLALLAIDNPQPTTSTWIYGPLTGGGSQYVNGFIAQSSTATLYVKPMASGFNSLTNIRLWSWFALIDEIGIDILDGMTAATVYQSTLADHLDQVVAGSQNAAWYVTRDGKLDARVDTLAPRPPVLTIKAGATPYTAAELELQSLTRSNDSISGVNSVTVNAQQISYTDGSRQATTMTYGPYVDVSRMTTYGEQAITIETQLGSERAARWIAEQAFNSPHDRITSVTAILRTYGDGHTLPTLEPFTPILVEDGINPPEIIRIASVTHTITANTWLVTITPLT